MLYILMIHELLEQPAKVTEVILEEGCFIIAAKNSSHAFTLLEKQSHLIDALIMGEKFFDQNPTFISQLRSHYHQRHISLLLMAENHGHSHDYLAIENPERLKEVLPALSKEHCKRPSYSYHFGELQSAQFQFRTLSEAHFLAKFLASQYPKGSETLVGISELFINAIEHGNLEISYEQKSSLLAGGRWIEEIDKRSADPKFQKRCVHTEFRREKDRIVLTITDEGRGFDWKKFESIDPKKMISSHGRGIMMARGLAFSELHYNAKGNTVTATYYLKNHQANKSP